MGAKKNRNIAGELKQELPQEKIAVKSLAKKETYIDSNKADEFINYVSIASSIAMSTANGTILLGLPGAALGFSTGVADEILINHGITNKHYLSTTAYWYLTANSTAVSALLDIINFIYKATPSDMGKSFFSTIAGGLSYIGPVAKPALALSASIGCAYFLNDFLDYKSKLENPLKSYFSMISLFDRNQILSLNELSKIGYTFLTNPFDAISIIANDVKEISNNRFLSLQIQSDLYGFIYQTFPATSAIISRYIARQLYNDIPALPLIIKQDTFPRVVGVIGELIGQLVPMITQHYQLQRQAQQIDLIKEKYVELLFEKGIGRKVVAYREGDVLIEQLENDLTNLVKNGAPKISKVAADSLNSLYSAKVVNELKVGYLLPMISALSSLKEQWLSSLKQKACDISNRLGEASEAKFTIISDVSKNLESIDLTNGENDIAIRYNAAVKDLTELIEGNNVIQDKIKHTESYYDAWLNVFRSFIPGFVNTMTMIQNQGIVPWISLGPIALINRMSTSYKTDVYNRTTLETQEKYLSVIKNAYAQLSLISIKGFVDFFNSLSLVLNNDGIKALLHPVLDDLSNMLINIDRNIHLKNLGELVSGDIKDKIVDENLLVSQQRIDRLYEIISSKPHSQVDRSLNNQHKLIVQNYHLNLDGKELVHITNLELEMGKHYAVTGRSGCGKTSTLIDLKEGVVGALSSCGEFSVGVNEDGKAPTMMFLTQKAYLPAKHTLIESIYYPRHIGSIPIKEEVELRKKVILLLEVLDIDGVTTNTREAEEGDNNSIILSRLDSYDYKLSGGQEKKIAFIRAIINQPDILIVDETFVGLDVKSLMKVLEILKIYLPNTTFLVVDHHAEDNNFNNFYDGGELHFENGTASLRDISPRELPEDLEKSRLEMLNSLQGYTNIFDLDA